MTSAENEVILAALAICSKIHSMYSVVMIWAIFCDFLMRIKTMKTLFGDRMAADWSRLAKHRLERLSAFSEGYCMQIVIGMTE